MQEVAGGSYFLDLFKRGEGPVKGLGLVNVDGRGGRGEWKVEAIGIDDVVLAGGVAVVGV